MHFFHNINMCYSVKNWTGSMKPTPCFLLHIAAYMEQNTFIQIHFSY